jgi:hypothetical protein
MAYISPLPFSPGSPMPPSTLAHSMTAQAALRYEYVDDLMYWLSMLRYRLMPPVMGSEDWI